MRHNYNSQIVGLGHYVPSQHIPNSQLEEMLQLERGFIERRTGIKARYWVRENETLVDLAERASSIALQNANIANDEIALTILATSTPDRLLPPTAPLLAHRLGLTHSGAFDLAGACCGFLYALTIADAFVRAQRKSVLLVAANILSRRINFGERESAILFSDAAGAVVLKPTPDQSKGILSVNFVADGGGYDLISISAGGSERPFSPMIAASEYQMSLSDGRLVFSKAVKMMVECAEKAVNEAAIKINDIDRFLPHQANLRMIEKTAKNLGMPLAKTITTITEYGNASAASMPLSLAVENQHKPFVAGEKILLTAAGAGMTGGALLFAV